MTHWLRAITGFAAVACVPGCGAVSQDHDEGYPWSFVDVSTSVQTEADFERLSPQQKVGLLIYVLEAQVNNGGFHQFFFNSSGYYTRETIDALERIGADITATLLKRAVAIAYPSGFPDDPNLHDQRLDDFEEISGPLDELDTRFYEYEDDLIALMNAFLAERS